MYNHIVNIDNSNNVFRYNNGSGWKDASILPGAYKVKQIDAEIKKPIKDNEAFNIIAQPEINRLGINILKDRFQVDRNHEHSITNFLGFTNNADPLAKGYHLADSSAVISNVHTVDLECNIIRGGVIKGEEKQIIYYIPSFTVPIGYKIIEQPHNINYFPLNTTLLDEITVRILDQGGNLINIPGEKKYCSLNNNKRLKKLLRLGKSSKKNAGDNTTTSIQLMQIAKVLKISNFYYVMRDKIKLLPKAYGSHTSWSTDKRPLYVMTNIHTSKEKVVHHICFYKGANGSFFFYLYGLPPTKEVKDFMGSGINSTFKIQEDGTKYCGQMSMFVLHRLNQGHKFTDKVLSLYKK